MQWYRALDTFAAELEDGAHALVSKGDTLPGSHELVKRDLAAQKADKSRMPLFAQLDQGEPPSKGAS